MEVKQHISKKPAGYWRNQKGKISRNKWQWKQQLKNLWDAAKAVLRGKFIAIQSYLKKQEKHRTDNLTSHLKQLETEEQKTTKKSRKKEIIKIQAEINEKEIKEIIVEINKTKSWFFQKINKIDKLLARFIKNKREKNQISKIRNEKGEVTIDSAETQRIIRDCYEQLYGNKMINWKKWTDS